MDLQMDAPQIDAENKLNASRKRETDSIENDTIKKLKLEKQSLENVVLIEEYTNKRPMLEERSLDNVDMLENATNKKPMLEEQSLDNVDMLDSDTNNRPTFEEQTLKLINDDVVAISQSLAITKIAELSHQPHVPHHPRKRLEMATVTTIPKKKTYEKFIYGNYSHYYGYRNKDLKDIRLDVFDTHRQIFCNKAILDIGCNSGFLTLEVAKRYAPLSIIGIDIDQGLINQAKKTLTHYKSLSSANACPLDVSFVHGDYVLCDDVLLELEREQFDVILCLSITKWIHLNSGDAGLKQAFRRMFAQLRSGGRLVLEAQSYDNYGRRKKMTDTIFANYKAMKFFPKQFTDYLLSSEVGFSSVELMGVPEHCAAGFKRPIQIFSKT